jgi:hypothetical protein
MAKPEAGDDLRWFVQTTPAISDFLVRDGSPPCGLREPLKVTLDRPDEPRRWN